MLHIDRKPIGFTVVPNVSIVIMNGRKEEVRTTKTIWGQQNI